MTVRFASFNVENLFARPRAFNQATWAEGRPILEAFAAFNTLIELAAYSAADKARMIDLLVQLDVYRVSNGIVRRHRTPTPKWAWLRANRGSFDVEHTDTGIEIVANGRSDWTGWLELATEPIDETKAAGSAIGSTTSSSRAISPHWSSVAASNGTGCGVARPTSTPRRSGRSIRRSPAPNMQPQTTQPSTSTSTSERPTLRGWTAQGSSPELGGRGAFVAWLVDSGPAACYPLAPSSTWSPVSSPAASWAACPVATRSGIIGPSPEGSMMPASSQV
jgi:hypothetical protein